jgi:hypothetical protein
LMDAPQPVRTAIGTYGGSLKTAWPAC